MSTDGRPRQILVTVGEGIGNMVETTPSIGVLSRFGKVWVWAKPTKKGDEIILDNPSYIENTIAYPETPAGPFDLVVQTYSANSNKDPRFGQFENVVRFEKEDIARAQILGEAAANLLQLPSVPWLRSKTVRPRSWVNCGTPIGIYDVVLNSGAYHASKCWPGFPELKDHIKKRGLSIRDFNVGEQKFPLPDVAATIREAGLYIGNDSGLAHIAAAVRTPAVILYGPTPIEKNLPYQSAFAFPVKGGRTKDGADLTCKPCKYQKATPKSCGFRCWESVPVERILGTAYHILETFYCKRRSG